MVSIDYTDGTGLARRAGHPVRPDRAGPVGDRPALRAGGLRGAQGLPLGRRLDRVVPGRTPTPRGCASSARRLAIPELPDELFVESLRQLIAVDKQWVPPAGGEESLYLRPFIFATEPGLGVRPAVRIPLPGDRLAGRRVLPAAASSPSACGCRTSTCAPPGRHRRGEVRRQLRRLAAGAGRGRRHTAATRWCGWTPSNAATSKRWAG